MYNRRERKFVYFIIFPEKDILYNTAPRMRFLLNEHNC